MIKYLVTLYMSSGQSIETIVSECSWETNNGTIESINWVCPDPINDAALKFVRPREIVGIMQKVISNTVVNDE